MRKVRGAIETAEKIMAVGGRGENQAHGGPIEGGLGLFGAARLENSKIFLDKWTRVLYN